MSKPFQTILELVTEENRDSLRFSTDYQVSQYKYPNDQCSYDNNQLDFKFEDQSQQPTSRTDQTQNMLKTNSKVFLQVFGNSQQAIDASQSVKNHSKLIVPVTKNKDLVNQCFDGVFGPVQPKQPEKPAVYLGDKQQITSKKTISSLGLIPTLNNSISLKTFDSMQELTKSFESPGKRPNISFSYGNVDQLKKSMPTSEFPSEIISASMENGPINFLQNSSALVTVKSISSSQAFRPNQLSLIEEGQERRLPRFIRKLRKLNNNSINFIHSINQTPEKYQTFNYELKQIIEQIHKTISSLQSFYNDLNQMRMVKRMLIQGVQDNVEAGSKEDSSLIDIFIKGSWDRMCHEIQAMISIRPQQNYIFRPFPQESFKKGLANYTQTLQKITKTLPILVYGHESSISKYLKTREALWSVEKNIKMMSEDLYTFGHSITAIIPKHYLLYRQILTTKNLLEVEEGKNKIKQLNQITSNDCLNASCIGSIVKRICCL